MGFKSELHRLKARKEPLIYLKIVRDDKETTNTVNSKIKEKYRYYICDYCNKEIKINQKWKNKSGAMIILPSSLTKCGKISVALHNRCLKLVLKELEEK